MQCVEALTHSRDMSSVVLCGWIHLLIYKYKVVVVLGVMVVPTTTAWLSVSKIRSITELPLEAHGWSHTHTPKNLDPENPGNPPEPTLNPKPESWTECRVNQLVKNTPESNSIELACRHVSFLRALFVRSSQKEDSFSEVYSPSFYAYVIRSRLSR